MPSSLFDPDQHSIVDAWRPGAGRSHRLDHCRGGGSSGDWGLADVSIALHNVFNAKSKKAPHLHCGVLLVALASDGLALALDLSIVRHHLRNNGRMSCRTRSRLVSDSVAGAAALRRCETVAGAVHHGATL